MTQFGGPEVLQLLELPNPQVGPGEVRIAVHAAAVNPTDTLLRSGARSERYAGVPPPYIPGMDAAGVLDEIGGGVTTDLKLGDHVMAIVVPEGSHGAYSELVVLPAESVVRTPRGASDAEAATLPMNGLTARLALDLLELEPGRTLAVTGAAGAVGGYVVELAKADGLTVIADASANDEALVRRLGADLVVPRGPGFSTRSAKRCLVAQTGSSTRPSSTNWRSRQCVTADGSPPSAAFRATSVAPSPSILCLSAAMPARMPSSTVSDDRSKTDNSRSESLGSSRPNTPPKPTGSWNRAASGDVSSSSSDSTTCSRPSSW